MKLKFIVAEDFVNYKKPSMFIGFPNCSFKCDKECGRAVCQNSALAHAAIHDIAIERVVDYYLDNQITEAIICGGLEPFDSWDDLLSLVLLLRYRTPEPIVIYTGYNEDEIQDKLNILKYYENIVVKFGRFIPDRPKRFDELLGVELASDNQYAKSISLDAWLV
jgi:organic radical activating enzyme